ncbi:MAG: hypothetical protein II547_04665, partial [Treponema sp.]|nr:hypothetical protein [Treponema sp.]
MQSITLTADSSQAVREVNNLSASLDELRRKREAAEREGNWHEAANLTREMGRIQNQGVAGAVGSNDAGSNLANTQNYNNARQLDLRLETITRVITTLTDQLAEATEKGQTRESFNLSAALNNAEQEKRQLEAEKKRLETAEKNDSSAMDVIKKYGVTRYLTQGLNYANQIAGIGYNHRIAMAHGDYLGADVSAVESGAGIAQGIGGSLLGAGAMLGGTPVGWGLMLAGGIAEIGGTIAKLWSGNEKADIEEGEAYRKTLAGTNALNKRFVNGGDWTSNSVRTTDILRQGTTYANGTGLSTDEFLDLATKQSRFGAKTTASAMQQAREVALWAQSTGTDAGIIQNFLGTARRYGDNSDVIGYASQARQAAGLTKAQNEEFLQSLQSVIEDGIANGYIKSTEDVSKTFVMFSRLSDNNPLWQGEQGMKRLQQMNGGISGATELQSVNDVIVASAAKKIVDSGKADKYLGSRKTGTYIDEMLLMEQGTNPEMFGEIARSVQSMEGGNPAAQIERFKDIYKLNYAGAVDVYRMAQNLSSGGMSEQDFANRISAMQKDRNYQSEETRWQDDINTINTNVAIMAQEKFWKNLAKLDSMAGETPTVSREPKDGGGTDIVTKAFSITESHEEAVKIATKANEDASETDIQNLDPVQAVNYVGALTGDAASTYGLYSAAVNAAIKDTKGVSFAQNYMFDLDGSFFAKLHDDGYGREKIDKETIAEIGRYAALGEKEGGLWGIGGHKADGKVTDSEIADAIRKISENKTLM